GLAETPELQALLGAQRTGDRNHPVLLERQEVPARVLAAQRKHRLRDLAVREVAEPVEPPAELDVRHGLDVEHEGVHECAHPAFMSTATATTSPASSVSVTCASPIPSARRTRSPRAENTTSGLPQEFCTTPTSRIHIPCEKPVPIALTIASLAAKRIATKRSRRWVRASCACSSGMSRCSRKRVPKRSSVRAMRPLSRTAAAAWPAASTCRGSGSMKSATRTPA